MIDRKRIFETELLEQLIYILCKKAAYLNRHDFTTIKKKNIVQDTLVYN